MARRTIAAMIESPKMTPVRSPISPSRATSYSLAMRLSAKSPPSGDDDGSSAIAVMCRTLPYQEWVLEERIAQGHLIAACRRISDLWTIGRLEMSPDMSYQG